MSYLDMDYDVSCLIGEYHVRRKKYNKVIDELHKLIDFNVHMKYVQDFQFYKCLSVYSCQTRLQKLLRDVVNGIIATTNKSNYIHDWPTKPPTFEYNRYLWEYIHTRKDNFIPSHPTMKGWRYKSYPPNKDHYPLETLKLFK